MFLENTSSGTLKAERLESHIIYKSLGVIKLNGLNRITNGYGHLCRREENLSFINNYII